MSTYTTIPTTLVATDRESATGHVDALLAAILADAASQGATTTAPHIDPLPTVATAPRYVIQHTTPGHWRLQDLTTGKSADGIDYTDFESARFERDMRNAEHAGGAL